MDYTSAYTREEMGLFKPSAITSNERQLPLLPLRVKTYLPSPNGRDVKFTCFAENGEFYYCKADDGFRRVRATELVSTRLAKYLSLATADHDIIEHDDDTFFGSRHNSSTADHALMASLFSTPQRNELGMPGQWPGQYLYQIHALDLLLNNPDRYPQNFVLIREGSVRKLCPIDFGSANLGDLATDNFPSSFDSTIRLGRVSRRLHGDFVASALEFVDRIEAIPLDVIDGILQCVPDSWLSNDEKRAVRGDWSKLGSGVRLRAIRAGLNDGSLA